ncbi:MAG: pyridoxamine 5'-phosphate oxidase family protein [Amphritea sp.]|nr:pyridoxamine 5'-phosphate oxidase family protein [Amphritea sp.]
MSLSETQLQEYQQLLQGMLSDRKTLQLATQGEQGPEASYAPFLFSGGCFYLFISDLAGHTQNMLREPGVGIMLIDDEQDCRNLFARQRVTFQCDVREISRSAEGYSVLLDQLAEKQGNTIDLLRTLGDFRLLELKPLQGRLVVGFGKAMEITLPQMTLQHIDAEMLGRNR